MLNFRFFQKINAEVIRRYRKHIFDPAGRGANAKDVYGREYKSYSNKGADVGWRSIGKGKNRKSVFIDSYANKKKTGKLKRQDEKFKDSKAPVLTGDLYKDFQLVKLGRSGFTFGNVARQSTVKFLKQIRIYYPTTYQFQTKALMSYWINVIFQFLWLLAQHTMQF